MLENGSLVKLATVGGNEQAPCQLRLSEMATEGPYEASRWLQVQALLSLKELQELFASIGSFSMFETDRVVKSGSGLLDQSKFYDAYHYYTTSLSQGKIPEPSRYQPFFSLALTREESSLYVVAIEGGRQILKVSRPVVQMRAYTFVRSESDGALRSMVLGPDSILWGIQFSYPQLFNDRTCGKVVNLNDKTQHVNTAFYRDIGKWIRHHSRATPFSFEGKDFNAPMRLGKECFSWINSHPQLDTVGLSVRIKE